MKKIFPVILFAAFVLAVTPAYASKKPVPTPTPLTVPYSVCIDAGHGGTDTGAVFKDPATGEILYKESDVNLDVAEKLQKLLLEADPDRPVFMTRTEYETTLDNRARYTLCNQNNAAILVSVHHNGSTDPAMNYTLSLYKKTEDVPLARIVAASVSKELGLENRDISLFTSGVLLKSDMPATISEAFFLTNENAPAMIANGALDKEALGLSNAINTYFSTTQ